jgi:hypothetical protein
LGGTLSGTGGSLAFDGGAGDQSGAADADGVGTTASGGPVLQRVPSSGILGCAAITWSQNKTIQSEVLWETIRVTNVGQSGTAIIAVTATQGSSSYVEHEQFSVIAGEEYSLSVGIPVIVKSDPSCPSPSSVLTAVVSLPGASTDVTVLNDSPKLYIPTDPKVPRSCSWRELTGPSTTSIGPPSQTFPSACNEGP